MKFGNCHLKYQLNSVECWLIGTSVKILCNFGYFCFKHRLQNLPGYLYNHENYTKNVINNNRTEIYPVTTNFFVLVDTVLACKQKPKMNEILLRRVFCRHGYYPQRVLLHYNLKSKNKQKYYMNIQLCLFNYTYNKNI